MAKHEVIIHENTGATKESAPYLGSYIAKETVKEDSFASSACAKAGMSPIQFRAIIDGSFQAIEELERQGLVRIHTDLGVICGHIPGSFPTADAAPDPEKNKLCLCLRLADDIRLSLADTVPAIVADDSLTKLRVDNVMDLETPRPYNLIHGQHVFRVAGYNMVLDDEGATVCLTDKNGVTYEVVVDEVISKQLFKGHTANLLQAGDYKLVVKSRAGDAEGPLQTKFRKVKYLYVEPDPLAVSEDGDIKVMTLGTLSNKTPCTMTGTNVGYDETDENGIHEVIGYIGGKLYAWKSSKGDGFGASEVTLTFDPEKSDEELPAPGAYDVEVAFERDGGSEGGEEIVSTRPVRVVID